MKRGIECSVRWSDNDLFELRISASNGAFAGTAEVYVAIGGLASAAARLEGFPRSPADARDLVFGAFGPNRAGGGASMRFYCGDGSGHARVDLKIESSCDRSDRIESAGFSLPIEASAVDIFVDELRRLESARQGIASLKAGS